MSLKNVKVLALALFFGLAACQVDEVEPDVSIQAPAGLSADKGTVTGETKKLENPYSVANMQKALFNVKQTDARKSTQDYSITANFLYVKIDVESDEQLTELQKDESLDLFEHPLDIELDEDIALGMERELADGEKLTLYASIKVDEPLPAGINYQVLEELFIPDDEEAPVKDLDAGLAESLVYESMKLTKNLEEGESSGYASRASKWRPAGTVFVWDDHLGSSTVPTQVFSHWEYFKCPDDVIINPDDFGNGGSNNMERASESELDIIVANDQCRRPVYTTVYNTVSGSYIPLEGAIVRARRWFTVRKGTVDASGNFSCNGRFRRKANYSIKWKTHNFAVKKSWLSTAKLTGPKKKGNWDARIKGGKQEFYAHIFRAAHHYYYKDIKNLRRPPLNSFWNTKLKLRAYYEDNDEVLGTHNPARRFLGLGNAIKIYNPSQETYELYATTIHEMAHASHWNLDRFNYRTGDIFMLESWAKGVEWELTRMVYTSYVAPYCRPSICTNPDTYPYTGVVQDLIDGRLGYDQVEGYTIRQVEDALVGEDTWTKWRNRLKANTNNATEGSVDALFAFWRM